MMDLAKEDKKYTEEELWNLADSCICALAKMEYYNIPHG